ncbi:MAG: sulfotransferase [Phenylobacterium zucineum]|nr:MAG: sulfotransferase [Phenylobacterium zucineum]
MGPRFAGIPIMSEDHRIDFIIIGAQKAGTTALFDHLSDDPALSLSKVKEVHFFDNETLDWGSPDYNLYHSQFDWTGAPIRGEATPIYFYWPGALERIAVYRRDIKLILLLRDPVERAWSHWRMEHTRGAETLPFGQAIRRGRQRLFQAEPWGHHRVFSYVERGFYAEQLERLFGIFGPEQLLILQSDDLSQDPDTVLTKINAFIGAPPPPKTTPRQVHVGQDMGQMDENDRAFLTAIYARDQDRLATLLDSRL